MRGACDRATRSTWTFGLDFWTKKGDNSSLSLETGVELCGARDWCFGYKPITCLRLRDVQLTMDGLPPGSGSSLGADSRDVFRTDDLPAKSSIRKASPTVGFFNFRLFFFLTVFSGSPSISKSSSGSRSSSAIGVLVGVVEPTAASSTSSPGASSGAKLVLS